MFIEGLDIEVDLYNVLGKTHEALSDHQGLAVEVMMDIHDDHLEE
jgi:hypothetical protein